MVHSIRLHLVNKFLQNKLYTLDAVELPPYKRFEHGFTVHIKKKLLTRYGHNSFFYEFVKFFVVSSVSIVELDFCTSREFL